MQRSPVVVAATESPVVKKPIQGGGWSSVVECGFNVFKVLSSTPSTRGWKENNSVFPKLVF